MLFFNVLSVLSVRIWRKKRMERTFLLLLLGGVLETGNVLVERGAGGNLVLQGDDAAGVRHIDGDDHAVGLHFLEFEEEVLEEWFNGEGRRVVGSMVDIDAKAGVDERGNLVTGLEEVLRGGESLVGGDHGGIGGAVGTAEKTERHGGNRRAELQRNWYWSV
jgi:hypothetical protein